MHKLNRGGGGEGGDAFREHMEPKAVGWQRSLPTASSTASGGELTTQQVAKWKQWPNLFFLPPPSSVSCSASCLIPTGDNSPSQGSAAAAALPLLSSKVLQTTRTRIQSKKKKNRQGNLTGYLRVVTLGVQRCCCCCGGG